MMLFRYYGQLNIKTASRKYIKFKLRIAIEIKYFLCPTGRRMPSNDSLFYFFYL